MKHYVIVKLKTGETLKLQSEVPLFADIQEGVVIFKRQDGEIRAGYFLGDLALFYIGTIE